LAVGTVAAEAFGALHHLGVGIEKIGAGAVGARQLALAELTWAN